MARAETNAIVGSVAPIAGDRSSSGCGCILCRPVATRSAYETGRVSSEREPATSGHSVGFGASVGSNPGKHAAQRLARAPRKAGLHCQFLMHQRPVDIWLPLMNPAVRTTVVRNPGHPRR